MLGRGFALTRGRRRRSCGLCRQLIVTAGKPADTIVFGCTHAFHAACLEPLASRHGGDISCYLCQSASTARTRGGSVGARGAVGKAAAAAAGSTSFSLRDLAAGTVGVVGGPAAENEVFFFLVV